MIQNIRKVLTVKAVKDNIKVNIAIDDELPKQETPVTEKNKKEGEKE